jgi:hypothetical protein
LGDRLINQLTLKKKKMINLQKLSLATLTAAILASVGGNAPATAAQLFFNISGNFDYFEYFPASSPPTIYDELDGGSFTGSFSIDSEEEDTNPEVRRGTYELSSWQIDLLTPSGDLVGQVTSADGGGSGEILVEVLSPSVSSFSTFKLYLIKIEDSLIGGTSTGLGASLRFGRVPLSCSVVFSSTPFVSCGNNSVEEFLESINSIDNALPDWLPKEIVGRVGAIITSSRIDTVSFTENGERIPSRGLLMPVGQVTAVSPPATVPEPSTTVGLCLLGLGFLLKKKVAFPKSKSNSQSLGKQQQCRLPLLSSGDRFTNQLPLISNFKHLSL